MNVRKIIKTFNKNVRKYVRKFEFFFNKIQDNKIFNQPNKPSYALYHRLFLSNHIFIDIIVQMRFEERFVLQNILYTFVCISKICK